MVRAESSNVPGSSGEHVYPQWRQDDVQFVLDSTSTLTSHIVHIAKRPFEIGASMPCHRVHSLAIHDPWRESVVCRTAHDIIKPTVEEASPYNSQRNVSIHFCAGLDFSHDEREVER